MSSTKGIDFLSIAEHVQGVEMDHERQDTHPRACRRRGMFGRLALEERVYGGVTEHAFAEADGDRGAC
jgi:hypothetical protein